MGYDRQLLYTKMVSYYIECCGAQLKVYFDDTNKQSRATDVKRNCTQMLSH